MPKKWYLYIAQCKDESFYTGISIDTNRRIGEHNNKKGAKSLYGKLPVVLVHKEAFISQIEAARREREIKGWNHKKKLSLISEGVYPKE